MQDHFQAQRARLCRAKELLKSEFVGLDAIIDTLVEGVTAWACMPDAQQRPTIISLWGLTGVGKSSLVRRLAHHMEWSNRLNAFDCGELKISSGLSRRLIQLAEIEGSEPPIILLDEFQRGFTVERGKEVFSDGFLWDWLDTGMVEEVIEAHQVARAFQEIRKLRQCLDLGVEVENGRVCKEVALYESVMDDRDFDFTTELLIGEMTRKRGNRQPFFIRFRFLEMLSDLAPRKWPTAFSVYQELIKKQTAAEMVDLFEAELRALMVPIRHDLRRSLVIVAGNLDDAFQMAGDLDADSDADVMKAQSAQIGLSEIKRALQERYKPEQIARLGNRHLIYPAFGRSEYQEIIRRRVAQVLEDYVPFSGFAMAADTTLLDLVYSEGVAPAQGVRPVLSTIEELVTNRLPGILVAARELKSVPDRALLFGDRSGKLVTVFYKGKNSVGEHVDQATLLNQKAKDNKSPATRAAISVHESGHALVQILQTGVFPTRLNCVTADRSLLGYSATKTGSSVQVHTFADKRKELQVLYAGLAAEEVVFGKELTTGGSSNDILRATRMAGILVKKKGLGSVHYHADPLSSDCEWSVKADDSALDKEVVELLEAVHADTLVLLEENKTALVGLAHRLFEQETLDETEIRRYLLDELKWEVPAEVETPFDALLQASFDRHCGLRRVG